MNNDLDLLISFLQPIKELLLDDTVSEIMGNPNGQWWFERRGRVEHAEVVFDAKALRTGLEVIANKLSRKLDETHPLLNAQLPDGSRLARSREYCLGLPKAGRTQALTSVGLRLFASC